MILGIGTDIVKISRVKDALKMKILSPVELVRYEAFPLEKRRREYLAGRFAAKEALKKAFEGILESLPMPSVTIGNDATGKPYLETPLMAGASVFLSLSHENEYAIAFCVVESEETRVFPEDENNACKKQ